MYTFATFDTNSLINILCNNELLKGFESWLCRKGHMAILPIEVVCELLMQSDLRESQRRFQLIDKLKTRMGNEKIFIAEGLHSLIEKEKAGGFSTTGKVADCIALGKRNGLFHQRINEAQLPANVAFLAEVKHYLRKDETKILDESAKKEFLESLSEDQLSQLLRDSATNPEAAIDESMWLLESVLDCEAKEIKRRISEDKFRWLGSLAFSISGNIQATSSVLRNVRTSQKKPPILRYDPHGWVDARILAAGIRSNFFVSEEQRLRDLATYISKALNIEERFRPISSKILLLTQ